jgi:hypothetical protein
VRRPHRAGLDVGIGALLVVGDVPVVFLDPLGELARRLLGIDRLVVVAVDFRRGISLSRSSMSFRTLFAPATSPSSTAALCLACSSVSARV